jgi:hypothetical protein
VSTVQWWFRRRWKKGLSPGLSPSLSGLAPVNVAHGAASLALSVNGNNFQPGETIHFGATVYSATFVSKNQLSATIAAADLATAGTKTVTVSDAFGRTSNGLTFTIT